VKQLIIPAALLLLACSIPAAALQTGEPDAAEFKIAMRERLYDGRFEELEGFGGRLLKSKARFPDGAWKLPVFYDGLAYPMDGRSEKDWARLLARLGDWKSNYPTSATPLVALGLAQLNYGWYARGGGWGSSVKSNQWILFKNRAADAHATLLEALALAPRHPDVFRCLMRVGMAENWSRDAFDATFREAVAIEPDYHDYYVVRATTLLDRWYGDRGEWYVFARHASKKFPTDREKNSMYTRIIWSLSSYELPDLFGEDRADWKTMSAGFAEMLEQYPKSTWNLNNYCRFSVLAGDRETARSLFDRIGDRPDLSAWDSRAYFDLKRAWARGDPFIPVDFAYRAPTATTVGVAGEFNNWEPEPMEPGTGGVWTTTLQLVPGNYGYKFVVNDNDWRMDRSTRKRKTIDGVVNSAVDVLPAAKTEAKP
jgi:hypothetical protein